MNREGECERLGVKIDIKCIRCIKEEKVSDQNYLGDFLIVKPPESLAIEERFIVEWEYTLFSLVPKNMNGIVLLKQTELKETLKPSWMNTKLFTN